MKISLIITNWNGLKILEKSFPVVLKNSQEIDEIVFADDGSVDGSLKYVQSFQKDHPKIKIVSHPDNRGFSAISNTAVRATTGDLVVLLNNDIFPEPNYLKAALPHFKDPKVFGVGLTEIGNENYSRIFFSGGYIQFEAVKSDQAHISAWISGGGCIVRRDIFMELGGFDEVYSPAYFEDLDLCFRAWKSGYKCIWEPNCPIIHKHGFTTSKLPRHFLQYVKERNHLLTVMRNITDKQLLSQNKRALILRVLTGPNYFKIIRAANIQNKRYPSPVFKNKLSDLEVLKLFEK